MSDDGKPTPDWSEMDRFGKSTCYCRCETVFRSQAKVAFDASGKPWLLTRTPCPACGRDDACRRVSSDPETMTIDGNKGA
jgi:hypothetical protein